MKNEYYYNISFFDKKTKTWAEEGEKVWLDALNSHRAVTAMIVFYRNYIYNNAERLKKNSTNGIVMKWSLFRVPKDEDGKYVWSGKRYTYAIATDPCVNAKRYMPIERVLL